MTKFKLMACAGFAVLLSGCATGNFGCPGMPDGVVCKRPSQVYAMTNESDRLGGGGGGSATSGETCGKSCQERKKSQRQAGEASALLRNKLLEPLAQPLPIREAPQVMRVWVAPYTDQNDDLHWPSFVYTEITKRRWSIGEEAAPEAVILTPMQVDSGAYEEAQGGDSGAGGSMPAPKSDKPKPIKSTAVEPGGLPTMPGR